MSILVFIASIVCIVDRAIIFQQRDIKWWETLVPFRNKYLFGKLCNQKIAGVIVAIANFLWTVMLGIIYLFERYLETTYYAGMYSSTQYILEVPAQETFRLNVIRIAVMVIAGIYMASYCYVMYKFSAMHGKSSKWIIGWAIAPVFFLTYFALSKNVSMYGKNYVMVRLDADKVKSLDKPDKTETPVKKVKRNDRRK